jgi:hypothetical protein
MPGGYFRAEKSKLAEKERTTLLSHEDKGTGWMFVRQTEVILDKMPQVFRLKYLCLSERDRGRGQVSGQALRG